ncbi:hypothetical protein M514_12067 [Trichuris suis]|uniref:HTH CENPB-type domain-containing protein n=1 Tax=Trichuris suis TaxID=68888 RepID=A0A085LQ33_9BILA|nr:hypothetical protein M513_12067 [Trichuris suis]KFD61359.1 hypothetical protein M514_12067 [Trichuris suis]
MQLEQQPHLTSAGRKASSTFQCRQAEGDGNQERKVMKRSQNEELELALYVCFIQKRSVGQSLSGPLLCEKVVNFDLRLSENPNVKIGSSWNEKFKNRHSIRELKGKGSHRMAIQRATTKKNCKDTCVQTNLMRISFVVLMKVDWKAFPKSLVFLKEESALGYKKSTERVTLMVCRMLLVGTVCRSFLLENQGSPQVSKIL